mgnify:CR=1 FL=1
MELTELINEREWRLCKGPDDASDSDLADAFEYFCANYWFIRHPERGRILFPMRDAQKETAYAWISNRNSIVLKARQIGFSTLAAAFAFWEVFFWADRFEVMLSRTEREAAKLLQKSKYGFKMLPDWMKARGPGLVSDNQLKMVFANDSAIESLPSGNDPARGESVYLVIVDEWAFLPNPEEAWASIEPVADVVAIEQVGHVAGGVQLLLDQVGDRALAGTRQSGEPHHAGTLALVRGACGLVHVHVLQVDVVRAAQRKAQVGDRLRSHSAQLRGRRVRRGHTSAGCALAAFDRDMPVSDWIGFDRCRPLS